MKTTEFIDITPAVSESIAVFPGDVGFRREVAMDMDRGQHLTLSAIHTTLHIGAHADAPNHYLASGVGIGERDLRLYMGKCLVLDATSAPRAARVGRAHLRPKWQNASNWPAERILVKTGSFPDPKHWNSDFCSLDPELINDWANAGVRLVGLDTPSIDPEECQTLDSHKVVAKSDMAILEGLVLEHVDEGLYTLIALPLRLDGCDASPVRAVLFRDAEMIF